MTRVSAENAWVEFPVPRMRHKAEHLALTGGRIDSDRNVVTALQDISFDLREGERLGLMGHNGAGKSTMLRMLAGVYSPTRGRVLTQGSISTLFNTTPGLSMDGTGRENIVACGLHLGLSHRKIAAKMDEIVDFAELGDYIDLPVRIYSSGMLTRLGFSIATAVEPEILLLDEGLATGDAAFAQKAEQRMQELIESSSILVIASHSEALLSKICTRCLLMEHGRILADGDPSTLFASYRASVVAAARANDAEMLHRAYTIAMDLMRRGAAISPDLEEQSLRYALRLRPRDNAMLDRYRNLSQKLPEGAAPDMRILLLARELRQAPENAEVRTELAALKERHLNELHESIAEVANESLSDALQRIGVAR